MTTGINTHTGLLNMPTLGSVQETLGNLPEGIGGRKIAVTYSDKPVSTESIVQHFKNDVRNLYQWVITTVSPMAKTLVETAEPASTRAQKTLTSVQGALKPATSLFKKSLISAGSMAEGLVTSAGSKIGSFSLPVGNAVKTAAPYVGTVVKNAIPGLALVAPIAIPLRSRMVSAATHKAELKRSEDANERIKNALLCSQQSTEDKLDLARKRASRLDTKKQQFTELKDRKIISLSGFIKCLTTVATLAMVVEGPVGIAAGAAALATRYYANRQEAYANEAMAKKYEEQKAEFEKIADCFEQQLEEFELLSDHADNLQTDLTKLQGKHNQEFEGLDKWGSDLQTQLSSEKIRSKKILQNMREERDQLRRQLQDALSRIEVLENKQSPDSKTPKSSEEDSFGLKLLGFETES